MCRQHQQQMGWLLVKKVRQATMAGEEQVGFGLAHVLLRHA
jgi:hypothetical protein